MIKEIIYSKKLVIGFVIAITFICLAMLSYIQCVPAKASPSVEEITKETSYNEPTTFPKKIYIADVFSFSQLKEMDKALLDWNVKTKGVAQLELVKNWTAPQDFNPIYYEYYKDVTVWKRDVNSIEVANLVVEHSFFSGLGKGNLIIIYNDIDYDDKTVGNIFKHEVGHIMGLGHLKSNYPGLMDIGGNQGLITKYDLILFCNLYSCLPETIE